MPVTKENVIEKAKELGLTLTEEQINAHVTIGVLPQKGDSGSHPGDDGDDGDDDEKDTLTEGMKKRLQKERDKRKADRLALEEANKKLRELEDRQKGIDSEKDKAAGNFEKLNKEATEAKAKADAAIEKAADVVKSKAIKSALESKLLSAGVPASRLEKSIKLFNHDAIEFEWVNKDSYEYEIQDFSSEIESFKKENDFLFEIEGSSSSGFSGGTPPRNGYSTSTASEKKKQELKNKFPRLFGVS